MGKIRRACVLGLAMALAGGGAEAATAQTGCARVAVESRMIHVCVAGHGPVAVVLAAGAGQTSQTWTALVAELSLSATLVTFDRPGFGSSDAGARPRTPTRIAQELGTVLQRVGVAPPYVLVGHSMGGLHVLRYAAMFPDRVEGIVLVDTPPAGFEEDRRRLLNEMERRERDRTLAEGVARLSLAARLEREGAQAASEWDLSAFPVEVPLVVITADSQDFGQLGSQEAHRALWIARSREWLGLSERSAFVVARGSGHLVHQERVSLVAEHVRRLVRGR